MNGPFDANHPEQSGAEGQGLEGLGLEGLESAGLVSAFVDGELSAEAQQRMAAQIEGDPVLAAQAEALARLEVLAQLDAAELGLSATDTEAPAVGDADWASCWAGVTAQIGAAPAAAEARETLDLNDHPELLSGYFDAELSGAQADAVLEAIESSAEARGELHRLEQLDALVCAVSASAGQAPAVDEASWARCFAGVEAAWGSAGASNVISLPGARRSTTSWGAAARSSTLLPRVMAIAAALVITALVAIPLMLRSDEAGEPVAGEQLAFVRPTGFLSDAGSSLAAFARFTHSLDEDTVLPLSAPESVEVHEVSVGEGYKPAMMFGNKGAVSYVINPL